MRVAFEPSRRTGSTFGGAGVSVGALSFGCGREGLAGCRRPDTLPGTLLLGVSVGVLCRHVVCRGPPTGGLYNKRRGAGNLI